MMFVLINYSYTRQDIERTSLRNFPYLPNTIGRTIVYLFVSRRH